MIARSILLPTLLLDEGDSGAYALGQQHADNFTWVLNALGEEVAEEVMEEQLIRPLVAWNYQTESYPKFQWRSFSQVDIKNMAGAFQTLITAGVVDAGEDFIREQLNLPPREVDPDEAAGEPPEDSQVGGGDGNPPRTQDEDDNVDESLGEGARTTSVRLRQSKHHDKFLFREVSERLDQLEDDAVELAEGVIRGWLEETKRTLRDKRIAETRDFKAVRKLRFSGVGELRGVFMQALGDSLHWGASDALGELQRGGADSGNPFDAKALPETMGINLAGPRWESLDVELVDPPTQNEILAAWKKKVPIQKALMAEYSREAFTMAGVYRDDLLVASQRVLEKGLRRGASYRELQLGLQNVFDPYLGTEGAVDPGVRNPYRLETVVRTNMAEAYNTGRMNLFRDPEVGDFIVAYEYSAVMDNRTTPFCTDWHGKKLPANDPRIDENNPPNHYRCRSVWIPIVRGETFQLSSDLPAATPADGFRFSCGCPVGPEA